MLPWMIVYSAPCPALEKTAAAVQPYLSYRVPCEKEPREGFNIIRLVLDGTLDGFTIDVSEADGEKQSITLAAKDEANLFYAASDFANIYLPYARYSGTHFEPYYLYDLFTSPMKPYHLATSPKIDERGIWLWGFTIGDYRRFIENMASLKFNMLTIWNDSLPVNIADVIDYAHKYGIRVYLGFAWGWDVVRPTDIGDAVVETLSDKIVSQYEREYAHLSCDGIYFQTFTEQGEDTINGILVADAAVKLVNMTASRILDAHPSLKIQFGLHATSVDTHLDVIAKVDPRIAIIWEDCGAFPFAYLNEPRPPFDKTLAFTKSLIGLNGGAFGAVLKGVICLNWMSFRHLSGSYMLGTDANAYVDKRVDDKREIFRYVQAYWLRHGREVLDMIRVFPKESNITCLVEDGGFEHFINLPTALYAAMLWDSTRSFDDILNETMLRPDVDLA